LLSGTIRAPNRFVPGKEVTMKAMLLHWQFWAILSATFAAMTAIFAKAGVDQIDPDLATFIRTVFIVIVLAAILLLSGLATGASWLCYFRALKLGDAARVAPIDKLSVVLVAVFATIFLGEHLSGPNWLGVVLIAGGAILVAYRG
jgi:transporter family protein